MKIAFLSPFYPYRGGIAEFSNFLFMALQKNCEIKPFTFTRQYPKFLFPGTSQFTADTDVKKDFEAVRTLDSINPFSYSSTANKILDFSPDLLLESFWMPFFAPSLGRVAKKVRKSGSKVISIMHNVVPHEPRFGDIKLTKYFLKQNDGFVLLSESNRGELEELAPGKKYIVHTHPYYDHYSPAIPMAEARAKLGLPQDKKILIYFGFIRDYKGLDLLIESMKYLDESYMLMIVGEVYGDFSKYQKIIDDNNLGSKIVKFTHYIPDIEIHTYFSAADVCTLTYRSATQSGIIGISYQFDIPVIATEVGGFKEQIENNNTGLLINTHEPKAISDAVQKYFSGNLKEKFIPNIKVLREKNSWSSLASEILELYKSL